MTDRLTPRPMDTAPQDGTEIVLHTPGGFCSYAVARWLAFKDGTGGAWLTDRNVACKACGETNTLQVVEPAGWLTIGEALSAGSADDVGCAIEAMGEALANLSANLRDEGLFDRGHPAFTERYETVVSKWDALTAAIAAMPVQSPPPIMEEGLVERLREEAEGLHRAELDSGPRMPLGPATAVMNEAADRLQTLESWATGPNGVKWYTARYAEQQAEIERLRALATPSSQEKHHGR